MFEGQLNNLDKPKQAENAGAVSKLGNYQEGYLKAHSETSLELKREYLARRRKMVKYLVLTGLVFAALVACSIWLIILLVGGNKETDYAYSDQPTAETSTVSLLPSGGETDAGNDGRDSGIPKDVKAEELMFGNYYEPVYDTLEIKLENFELPQNSKADISNYYEVARKIDLEPFLDDFNKSGFAVIDQKIESESENFFAVYRSLLGDNIPILITNDFLFYYFQNKLKEVFEEIKKSVFYENVWSIYLELYEKALERYESKKTVLGISNDPLLEGSRQELAYLAVALDLLEPEPDQINKNANFDDLTKFSPVEADKFGFYMPEYLSDDVDKEIMLIKNAAGSARSPVMYYEKDYTVFRVPAGYRQDAKLNNFYLATRWLNSVFPLNFRSDECIDCLLDFEDWRISMISSGYLSSDISRSQDLKNQWAVVYKFISFFEGLRSDLTYLHYDSVYRQLFGNDYSMEGIYGETAERDANLLKAQAEIGKTSFLELEGGIKRGDENRKQIGMRILQENYWPNDFIFGRLTGTGMKPLEKNVEKNHDNITFCRDKKTKQPARCSGIGLDIANLIYPIKDNEYFTLNSFYDNYIENSAGLKNDLGKFDRFSWNNNNYWATLDIGKRVLDFPPEKYPVYMQSERWKQEIGVNTLLGAWVNLHLDKDQLLGYFGQRSGFRSGSCNQYNYVLPDLEFINELIAKTKMFHKMSDSLGITRKAKTIESELTDFERLLSSLKDVVLKELANERMEYSQCDILVDFASLSEPKEAVKREFSITTEYGGKITESIKGYKLLAVVYKSYDGKIILAIGPIFNYREF